VATGANADTQVQVQAGDTVWNFAQQYDTTVNAIAQRNQLANPNFIQIGQKLIIPDSATSAGSQAASAAGVGTAGTTATAATTATSAGNAVTSTTANVTATSAASTTSANNFAASTVTLTSTSTASSATGLASATTVLSSTPASAATSTSQAATSAVASQTDYATNSAAALRSMSNYVISYGTVEETAASYNNGSQTAQPTQTAQSDQATATTDQTQASANTSTNNSSAVATAKSMIGVPYVWGGNTPSGFDCSGLVQYSYNLGPNYRTTYQQTNLGTHKYDVENAQSGDLYFWGTESAPYHVAIAEGNGNYIQAPTPGQNVQEGNIQYYRPNYYISMNQ
jgi:cell wall-associated NlpC family hydrolase